jgi:hypothetical protein
MTCTQFIALAGLMVSVLFFTEATNAQLFQQPGVSPVIPLPPPPPIPPPKIEVPVVPQFDAPPQQNLKPLSRRKPYDERIVRCLDEAAAAGLKPNERAAYSRACANQ